MTLLLRHYDMAGEMTGDGNMLRMNPRPVGYNMGVTNANTNTKTGTVLPTYNPNLPPSAIPVTGTYTATPYTPAPYNPGFQTPQNPFLGTDIPTDTSTDSTDSSYDSFTIPTQYYYYILLGLIGGILLIVLLVLLYRKYRSIRNYNDTPQHFSHRPDLGLIESYNLSHTPLLQVVNPDNIRIIKRDQHEGKQFEVSFLGVEQAMVYYPRRIKEDCYFEVEIIKLNACIDFGYVYCDDFKKLASGEYGVGNLGITVNTYGKVVVQGENVDQFGWELSYGDVLGIGITKEMGENQRRAWVSRNGVLLNPPPAEEMDKWIASANFSQEEKQDYRSGVGVGVGMSVGNVSSDKNAKYAIQREKELRKHRIVLNRMKPFDYYAVLCYTGCKSDDKITIVNMNVGGAVFRMYDEHFRSGLL